MPYTKNSKKNKKKYNTKTQTYMGIHLRLIVYTEAHFARLKAKRFLILNADERPTGQNLWIPNSFLLPDGSLDTGKDLSWIFRLPINRHKFQLAGIAPQKMSK